MAKIEERLKKAHKRFRERGKLLATVKYQRSYFKRKYEIAELRLQELSVKYQTQCKIKMEYIPEKNAYAFVNGITGKIYICTEEPRRIGELSL